MLAERYPLLVRWVTDFDCGQETEWWHCIKDEPFDIANIPAKKRYEISKGLKNVDVRIITPGEYAEELAEVLCKARIHYGETLDYAEEKEQSENPLQKILRLKMQNTSAHF